MAHLWQIGLKHYSSWRKNNGNKAKYEITQEICRTDKGKKVTRLAVSNKSDGFSKITKWYEYPFTKGINILTILQKEISAELGKDKLELPLVETTSNFRSYGLVCSSYLLNKNRIFKLYMPIRDTIDTFELYRENNICFTLTDGNDIYKVEPKDIIAILEE